MSSIRFTSFPRTNPPAEHILKVVEIFQTYEPAIATVDKATKLKSDDVLAKLRPGLEKLGFKVEAGKSAEERIIRPVFFGENGQPTKTYSVDAYWDKPKCGLEIEAGRAIGGNAIYRDLIQAMVMVELDSLCLAVPNIYRYAKTQTKDYELTIKVADALYGHTRIAMPYHLTVIGY